MGKFEEGCYSDEEMVEKGKLFWNTFIQKRIGGLKQILEEGYRRKTRMIELSKNDSEMNNRLSIIRQPVPLSGNILQLKLI